jgi:hypothetical protein
MLVVLGFVPFTTWLLITPAAITNNLAQVSRRISL